MAHLWSQIRRLASHVRFVLLTGEPDCGQEAVARLLLDLSAQPQRSFLKLTAAEADNRLLRATGLTSLPNDVFLFIPDIDRYSLAAQESLLRLMRLRRSRPFTIIAATTEDLRPLAGLGRFSPELADALGSVRLALPSLKERVEDIPMLISQILATQAQAGRPILHPTESFLRAAMQHPWPGNLAELAQATHWLCASGKTGELVAEDLFQALAMQRPARPQDAALVRMVPLDTVVHEHICAVLRACRGNKLKASEILGISRSTLYRMLDAAATQHTLPIAS